MQLQERGREAERERGREGERERQRGRERGREGEGASGLLCLTVDMRDTTYTGHNKPRLHLVRCANIFLSCSHPTSGAACMQKIPAMSGKNSWLLGP